MDFPRWDFDVDDDYEYDRRAPSEEEKVLWLARNRNVEFVTYLTIEKADWIGQAGSAIANSRYLRQIQVVIEVNDNDDNSSDDWLKEVCDSISRNRSIEKLSLSMVDLRNSKIGPHRPIEVDVFNALAPFVEQNDKLRYVEIDGVTSKEFNSLALTLSKYNLEHLERVAIRGVFVEDEDQKAFFDSLREKKNLSRLVFDAYLHPTGCKELANLLICPASNICSLDVNIQLIEDEDLSILSNAFIKKNKLMELNMWGQGIELTSGGWGSFFAVLSHPNCSLERLRLDSSFSTSDDKDDEVISCLGVALAVNTTLKHLCLDSNHTITTAGWHGFLNCLRNPHSALESLRLRHCEIGNEVAVATVTALAENSTIKVLDMYGNSFGLSGTVLARVLYDKTSINSTYSSNHTLVNFLGKLEYDTTLDEVTSSLELNKDEDKSSVARKKIMKHHFPGGGAGIQAFATIPETAMPNAIEWIGRDNLGYSLMYDLARGLPTLFNRREIRTGEKKRKR